VPERLLAWVACAFLGLCVVALPAAMLGVFVPVVVVGGGAAAAVGAAVVWERSGPRLTLGLAAWPTVFVVALAALACLVNARYSSQHLLTDRDPGVYATHALWLAKHNHLLVETRVPAFAGDHGLRFSQQGYFDERADGRLYPQFLHLTASLLAVGAWVRVRLLFMVDALLGSLALLFVYAFGTRLMRPWAAAVATATLAVLLPQVHFSRDTFSEPATELTLFAGLWLLWAARDDLAWPRALIAGGLLGVAMTARVDSWVLLLPLVVYVFWERTLRRGLSEAERDRHGRYLMALSAGVVVPTVLGMVDGYVFCPPYLRLLGGRATILPIAAVALAAVLMVVARMREGGAWDGAVQAVRRNQRTLAGAAAVAVVVVAGLFWFVRPRVQTVHRGHTDVVAALQKQEHVSVDGSRTYDESTVARLAWYLGPVGLGAGFIGFALLTGRLVRGGPFAARVAPFLLMAGATTLLYAWTIDITPDQIWATRRFLPISFPALVLGAGLVVDVLWARWGGWGKGAALAAAGAALVYPAAALLPVRTERSYAGMVDASRRVCAAIPADAVVVVPGDTILNVMLPQTVRDFCHVPVAQTDAALSPQQLAEYKANAARAGRRLFLVSGSSRPTQDPAAVTPRLIVSRPLARLEETISRRPSHVVDSGFELYVAPA